MSTLIIDRIAALDNIEHVQFFGHQSSVARNWLHSKTGFATEDSKEGR
jgi:hypothetical protein